MIKRPYWQQLIENAWERRSIVWLTGVRRVGKTVLCQSLSDIEYFDCELPRIRQVLEDPEGFLNAHRQQRIVLDEIHRLDNPSEILKIAADHYPDIKIIATGSSTLGASSKFSDTLTGRKIEIWLTPLLVDEFAAFDHDDLIHRLLRGGLPPFFMSELHPELEFQEWLDAYWARDIQSLFRLEKRYSFLKFTELLLAQSGNLFEATRFAAPCEVSRQTIMNYLSILEATVVAHVIRPFTTYKSTEIVSAPKVFGFDTGFVCHVRGWLELRREDLGVLWEHLVLNEMQARLSKKGIYYWRDKQKHEIDFVYLKNRKSAPITIECKWQAKKFSISNLNIFRKQYPIGNNYVVAQDVTKSFEKKYGDVNVIFVNLKQLIATLSNV